MSANINRTVLMSGTDYFSDQFAINAYMDSQVQINSELAKNEHLAIRQALEQAGIKVIQVPPPANCQDGVYVANWGLGRGNKVVLSSLPNKRRGEEPYAEAVLAKLNKQLIRPAQPFSGQGDALPCGNLLFCGSGYRTNEQVYQFLAAELGYEVIGLRTTPKLDAQGKPAINAVTGWPDSFFYDLDLALAILTPKLIAWCPEAFVPASQSIINSLDIDKIEVSLDEARHGFGCNLISSGETVVMSAKAPKLQAAIESHGLKTITTEVSELVKGGGYIRCIALTLDND